jgi:hypothetical protein
MDSRCKRVRRECCDREAGIGCNRVFVLLMGKTPRWIARDIMKAAGAEPIKYQGASKAMDTIGFAAPAVVPLTHERDRIKCSLR